MSGSGPESHNELPRHVVRDCHRLRQRGLSLLGASARRQRRSPLDGGFPPRSPRRSRHALRRQAVPVEYHLYDMWRLFAGLVP